MYCCQTYVGIMQVTKEVQIGGASTKKTHYTVFVLILFLSFLYF